MTNTTNYNLKKPDENDNVLIGDLNENADAIDQALHGLEEGKAAKAKPAKAGSLAALDESGNLTDSGRTPGAAGGVATLDEGGKVPEAQLPEMNYDPAGSADKVQQALNSHTSNKQNPHGVTAEQAGADPAGTASSAVSSHNQDAEAHPALQAKLNGVSMAVKATYPISTGQTITQGDVVDVVDGSITRTLTPHPNVENVLYRAACNGTASCAFENKNALVLLSQSSPYSGSLYLLDSNCTALGSVAFDFISSACDVIALSDSTAIASLYNGAWNAYVCTISGSSITKGGQLYIATSSESPTKYCKTIPLSETTFLAVYGTSSGLRAKIGSVSGTTINFGSYVALSGNISATYISATRLPDSGTTRRVCVFYRIESNNLGQFVICNISASNQITWGSPVTFESDVSSGISSTTDGNDAVFSYVAVGDSVKVNKVLGGTTLGTATTIGTDYGGDTSIQMVDSGYLVLWSPSSGLTATLLSNSLSSITSYQFDSPGNQYPYLSSALTGPNSVLAAYSDRNNSNYGTATTLNVSGNQIAGSFLVGSKDAIALQSGTSGQSVEVIYSGTVAADWVTEGQVIKSDGVYGAGIMDKVLQVWSKDRPADGLKYAIVEYTGTKQLETGSNAAKTIEVGFYPIAFFMSVDNAGGYNNIGYTAYAVRQGRGSSAGQSGNGLLQVDWTDTGFTLYALSNSTGSSGADSSAINSMNSIGKKYHCLVLGV